MNAAWWVFMLMQKLSKDLSFYLDGLHDSWFPTSLQVHMTSKFQDNLMIS